MAAGWKNEDVGWYGYSYAINADSNGSHGATNQPSTPDSQKPIDPIASAREAYDAAKAAYDAIDVEGARRTLSAAQTRADEAARVSSSAQVAYEEAAKAAEPLKDAQDVATAQVTRANTKAIAAQYSLNAAEQTLADIKEGTIIPSLKDFFVDMNSDYALRQFTRSYQGEVLTEINEATHSGIAGDCTDYRNVLRALDTIRDLNKVRASLGLNELMVSDELMARETVSTNWSANNIAHSTGCGAENLAWGWNKPVDGWYASEKRIWDQAVETNAYNGTPLPDGWQTMSASKLSKSAPDFYHAVGHYLNVIDKSYTVVGAACNTNGSIVTPAMGQTYRSYAYDDKFTVDQWEERFRQWVDNKLNNADRNQAIQKAEEERDAALASLTAANKELAEAQEAQETATARYNAAMKDVNAKKATADKEAAAAQKAAQDLAGAQAAYDKAVSDKRTALASLDAAREKLEQLTS